MKIIKEVLSEVYLLESPFFTDDRGGFLKLFNRDNPLFDQFKIQQINYVESTQKDTLRGLHYQTGEFQESKVFRAVKGSIQLAFADTTDVNNSAMVVLDNPAQCVLIPRGFATGYLTLSEFTTVLYISDNEYNVNVEKGIRWDDAQLKVNWMTQKPVLSEKDKKWADWGK